jgi:hypothetical protein
VKPLSLSWPDDLGTIEEADRHREAFAPKTVGRIADHPAGLIGAPKRRPAIIGHSFGGLPARNLAGRGLSAASAVIDPAPFRGVLPLPVSPAARAGPGAHQRRAGAGGATPGSRRPSR